MNFKTNILLISVLVLGLMTSPLSLSSFSAQIDSTDSTGLAFAQGKPEDVGPSGDNGKPEDVGKQETVLTPEVGNSKQAEKQAERETRLAEKQAERETRLAEKQDQIQQRLAQKTAQLEKREQALLGKLNAGTYHGPLLGGDAITTQYIISFKALEATAIGNSGDVETFAGDITLENVVSRGNNLKLKVTGCNLIGENVTYNCAFGKARAISSGTGGEKDSMVIIAFLEDDFEGRSTLKIMLDANTPIKDIGDGITEVNIKSPQSRIGHEWFVSGDATISVTGSSVNPDFTGILGSTLTDEEDAAEDAVEAEAEAAEDAAEAEAEAAEDAAEAEAEAEEDEPVLLTEDQ